jgi:rRNA maturation endonuclease Nob1
METEGATEKNGVKREDEPAEVPLKAFQRFEAKSRDSLQSFERFELECQACQSEAEPHWQFCAHCGTRLATRCPACDTPLPPSGAQTCPHCGVEIPEVAPKESSAGER